MTSPAPCGECQAILEQLRTALAEIRRLPKTDDEWREAWPKAASRVTAETTEQEFDELLDKYPFRFQPEPEPLRTLKLKYPGIVDAFRRMFEHQVRTGHKILRRPPMRPEE